MHQPPEHDPDRELVAAAQFGDEAAIRALITRHTDALLVYATRMIGSRNDAPDVVQEVWIAVMRNLHNFEFRSKFTTWIYQVTHRKAIDYLRSQSRRPVDYHAEIPEGAMQPASSFAHGAETRLDVAAALLHVPEEFRAAIVLVDINGMAIDDAAAALEVAPGTIKSRLFRGRAMLAKVLGTSYAADASTPMDAQQ